MQHDVALCHPTRHMAENHCVRVGPQTRSLHSPCNRSLARVRRHGTRCGQRTQVVSLLAVFVQIRKPLRTSVGEDRLRCVRQRIRRRRLFAPHAMRALRAHVSYASHEYREYQEYSMHLQSLVVVHRLVSACCARTAHCLSERALPHSLVDHQPRQPSMLADDNL
jgi:hypothetical protein